ncbi:hypothetical protein CMUS01_06018 [Colletotrichum musicola]|uniref:Uncharacterized protein n=1 Tax=Colletotrichum musicola TaxID=2175873 RepID=A0A8H6KNK7_9PEZI|nr:hypothetical protein CMUS01_06018 [Colletotrichum musicola]
MSLFGIFDVVAEYRAHNSSGTQASTPQERGGQWSPHRRLSMTFMCVWLPRFSLPTPFHLTTINNSPPNQIPNGTREPAELVTSKMSNEVGFAFQADVVNLGSLTHMMTGRVLKALSDGGVDTYAVASAF